MDFNFGFNADPEMLDKLRAAFQKAADADTGNSQQLFQTLSDKFNQLADTVQEGDLDIMSIKSVAEEFQMAFVELVQTGFKNPAVIDTLMTLQNDMRAAVTGGSMDKGFDQDDQPAAKPEKKKNNNKKKPGDGKFKL